MFRSFRARFQKKEIDEEYYQVNPVELSYRISGPWVTSIPASHYRSNLLGFRTESNPFIKTLLSGKQTFSQSYLRHFYEQFQPETIGDVLNISTSKAASYPAMSTVMPWWTKEPNARLVQVCVSTDRKPYLGKEAYHLGADEGSDFGWHHFGPVSSGVGEMEFDRQYSVFNSIRTHGYQPTSPLHIHGEFLIHGADWVWINIGGKHRFNALVALDHDIITVSVKNKYGPAFVRRDEVDFWPNVINGWFDREEALQIFDQLMLGRDTV